jgi:hypothetical protein
MTFMEFAPFQQLALGTAQEVPELLLLCIFNPPAHETLQKSWANRERVEEIYIYV